MENAEAIIRHPEWGTQPFMDQFYYETRAVAIAAARYYQLLGNTFNRGAGSGSIVIQRFMMRSHVDLAKHIEKMQVRRKEETKRVGESSPCSLLGHPLLPALC